MNHSYSTGSFEIFYTYTAGRASTWLSPAEEPQLEVEEVWVTDDDGAPIIDINSLLTNDKFEALFGALIFDRLVEKAVNAEADERAAAAEYRRDMLEDC